MLEPSDLVPGRRFRSEDGVSCRLERVFGRGRNRQVVFVEERDPTTRRTVPVRSFQLRFSKLQGKGVTP